MEGIYEPALVSGKLLLYALKLSHSVTLTAAILVALQVPSTCAASSHNCANAVYPSSCTSTA